MVSNKDTKSIIDTVTSVTVQNGSVYVTTRSSRPGVENPMIPYRSPIPWILMVPEQGDMVEVYELEDGSTMAKACHSLPQGDYSLPDLGQRDFIIKPDPNTEVRISGQSGSMDINIKASGTVNVDGDSITLGTDGGDKPLVTDVNTGSDGTVSSVEKTTKTSAE